MVHILIRTYHLLDRLSIFLLLLPMRNTPLSNPPQVVAKGPHSEVRWRKDRREDKNL